MKTILIILAVIGILLGLAVIFYLLLVISFKNTHTPKNGKKIIEKFLNFKLGKDYEVLDHYYRFAHSDCPWHFSLKLPKEKFDALIKHCEQSVQEGKNGIKKIDDGFTKKEGKTGEGFIHVTINTNDRLIHYSSGNY